MCKRSLSVLDRLPLHVGLTPCELNLAAKYPLRLMVEAGGGTASTCRPPLGLGCEAIDYGHYHESFRRDRMVGAFDTDPVADQSQGTRVCPMDLADHGQPVRLQRALWGQCGMGGQCHVY